jgi:hypothetical protein
MGPKTNTSWTTEDDARLAELAAAGLGSKQVAALIGKTVSAVNNRCYLKRIRFDRSAANARRIAALQKPVAERFFNFVSPEPNSGCWLWAGSCDRKGYGQLRVQPKSLKYATHVSWEIHRGPTNGMHLCHKCDNPNCVNPDHLFLGTQRDNTHDMMKKGRADISGLKLGHGRNKGKGKPFRIEVSWQKQRQKFAARIFLKDTGAVHVGRFLTRDLARDACMKALRERGHAV